MQRSVGKVALEGKSKMVINFIEDGIMRENEQMVKPFKVNPISSLFNMLALKEFIWIFSTKFLED